MAPNPKKNRVSGRGRDKQRRKRRYSDTEQLYKTIGKICGEECEHDEINMVSETMDCELRRGSSRRSNNDDVEMACDDIASDEEEFEPKQRTSSNPVKVGRVTKSKPKKSGEAEFSMQMGLQKAQRFIAEALDFGVRAGYLTPKDSKGKVLQVSTELLYEDGKRGKGGRRCSQMCDSMHHHHCHLVDDAEEFSDKGKKIRQQIGGKKVSDVRKKNVGKRRSAMSRSRSRSKRRQAGKRRMPGESPFPPTLRTENPDGEQTKPAAQGETEQDDLEAENPEINADEQEEKKSIKSQKSSKGLAKIEDDKKSTSNHEENSNDEASEEDEEEGEPKK